MKIPLQISTRKISLSKTAINVIKSKTKKLERFYDKIIACRVVVETPHRHKNQGSLFNVSIDLSVPGSELAVKREAHEDIYVAIRDAFEAARRQLLHYSRKHSPRHASSLKDNVMEQERIIQQEQEQTFFNQFDDPLTN